MEQQHNGVPPNDDEPNKDELLLSLTENPRGEEGIGDRLQATEQK